MLSRSVAQTTFSKSYVSQSVSLHDTTGRLCSGKCYLRSFPHFPFSSSARNSIAISTAPQQDLLISTQPQPVVSNVLISVCSPPSSETLTLSSDPSVSTRDQPLVSPAICSTVVRLIYLICLALLWPKCPIFGPNFASMMFPALQALDATAVPITSCSHPCCAQTGPLHSGNSDCLVLYILCLCVFLCFTVVFVSSLLLFAATSIFGPRPASPCSHTSFCMFSPAAFHRIPVFFSPATISSCIPQSTATFLPLLWLLPLDSAFCSTMQHLAYGLALVFVCIPATISFSSCLFAVNCSARHF